MFGITPERALSEGWGLLGSIAPAAHGVTRPTWRVAEDYWLTCVPGARMQRLQREHELLARLTDAVAEGFSLQVPVPVPTKAGDSIWRFDDTVWRLTKNLPGEHPDPDAVPDYRATTEGLATLHRFLARLPHSAQVSDGSDLIFLKSRLSVPFEADWEAATTDLDEKSLVLETSRLLRRHLSLLERAPAQIIHGDWAITNFLVLRSPTRLVGVLDFDQSTYAPVALDLAQAASSVLMWSNIDDKVEAIRAILDAYQEASGIKVPMPTLQVAVVAYWLMNYWRAREGMSTSAARRDPGVARQPGRLRNVLEFASSLT